MCWTHCANEPSFQGPSARLCKEKTVPQNQPHLIELLVGQTPLPLHSAPCPPHSSSSWGQSCPEFSEEEAAACLIWPISFSTYNQLPAGSNKRIHEQVFFKGLNMSWSWQTDRPSIPCMPRGYTNRFSLKALTCPLTHHRIKTVAKGLW